MHRTSELTTPPFPSPPARRALAEEVVVVLALTFLASAVFAIIDLLSAPLAGIRVSVYANVSLANQLASIVFSLAPVALVFYLVRRNAEGLASFGLDTATFPREVAWGVIGGIGVAAVGLAIYLAAIAAKINRFVVPVPPLGHWWTVPVLVLGAAQTALAEEIIVTSGGKKTSPAHIESMLKGIPPVGQAVVIGERRNFLVALLTLDNR